VRVFKHPAFPQITTTCEDDAVDEHIAKGWVPLLDDEQQARFEEIELETELDAPPSPPRTKSNPSR
jgi:hypothetical protein